MLTKTNKCKLNNRQHVGIKPFSRCTAESEIGSSSLCKYSTAYVIMQAESEAPSFKQAALTMPCYLLRFLRKRNTVAPTMNTTRQIPMIAFGSMFHPPFRRQPATRVKQMTGLK